MKNFLFYISIISFFSCINKEKISQNYYEFSQQNLVEKTKVDSPKICKKTTYKLSDFYKIDTCLDKKVDSAIAKLDDKELLGQMFIVAYETTVNQSKSIIKKIQNKSIGGVLMLRGSKNDFKEKIKKFSKENVGIPLLFSADAELSLINSKISGIEKLTKANKIKTIKDLISETQKINKILKEIGINQNFAPSADQSKNRSIISNRSFSRVNDSIIKYANQFIKTTQEDQIIATAKHFPGHGLVKGDSHKELVYIDGEMKELNNFSEIIPNTISVMIGHISVRNNTFSTEGIPASCSKKMVTDLLRDSLKYKGLIVTDAMNMYAATSLKNAEQKAILAGCDMIVMPVNHTSTIKNLEKKMKDNALFREQILASVKRIVRLKICLNLL